MYQEQLSPEPKRRGAPLGNQNARKHGFYSRYFDKQQTEDYYEALESHDLEAEIAAARVKVSSVMRHDPANTRLIMRSFATIGRLVYMQQRLARDDQHGMKQAIIDSLRGNEHAIAILEDMTDD
ncbi:hypothetical protein DGWBC_0382 [Dehalogenimonas sp. WBC-2]|nr:hypothetical protein DGWBC_0382 [Dehalogenimonas sp. WBC-2]